MATTRTFLGAPLDDDRDDDRDETARIGVMWSTLQLRVLEMAIDARQGRPPSGVRVLGEGQERIDSGLDELEPKCRHEVSSFRVVSRFDVTGAVVARNASSMRRGVRVQAMAGSRVLAHNPFWSSEFPFGRYGPVVGPAILMDRSAVLLPGPMTTYGGETAWLFTRPEIVQAAYAIWDAAYAVSVPADPAWPRYNERQLGVARRRGQGWTNARIARDLGISARTVTSDLQRLPTLG